MNAGVREWRASGLNALALATHLLQRSRLADPEHGVWEAADVQWWWRTPRTSDQVEQLFWLDEDGPVAAVLLTDWGELWGCDPLVVPRGALTVAEVWRRAFHIIEKRQLAIVETLARDDDEELIGALKASHFVPGDDRSGITWMDARGRVPAHSLADGFELVDRVSSAGPHPLNRRSGDIVEVRLRQCSLYDPWLDLAVRTTAGELAAYALFWFDPLTRVGLVEPMRVEDGYQRRGIGRALLSAGLDRLVRRGASRLKVGYATDAALRLYVSAGFQPSATLTPFRRRQ